MRFIMSYKVDDLQIALTDGHDSLLTVYYFVGALHFISPVSFSSVMRIV